MIERRISIQQRLKLEETAPQRICLVVECDRNGKIWYSRLPCCICLFTKKSKSKLVKLGLTRFVSTVICIVSSMTPQFIGRLQFLPRDGTRSRRNCDRLQRQRQRVKPGSSCLCNLDFFAKCICPNCQLYLFKLNKYVCPDCHRLQQQQQR